VAHRAHPRGGDFAFYNSFRQPATATPLRTGADYSTRWAELRLVAEPQAALAGFAEQKRLESAMPVLQRFLRDVVLWVVVD
jgi:hypothetical protein